jgi:hypothetical protein
MTNREVVTAVLRLGVVAGLLGWRLSTAEPVKAGGCQDCVHGDCRSVIGNGYYSCDPGDNFCVAWNDCYSEPPPECPPLC